MTSVTRRSFSKTAALAGVGTAVARSRVLGANDRVRLGFIGLGNRGDQVLEAFLTHGDAEVVAICDLWQPYLDFAARRIGSGNVVAMSLRTSLLLRRRREEKRRESERTPSGLRAESKRRSRGT